MNRRNLLKILGISAVGVATVPLWLDAWTTDDLPEDSLELNEDKKLLLSEIVDTLIPPGEIPGAKDLEVDKFVRVIVANCLEEDIQREFLAGFDELESVAKEMYDKSFKEIPNKERLIILEKMAANKNEGKEINFVEFVKELTITGYMNSQYVMENLRDYEFIPGRFDGSFPVEKTIYSTT
ncbi:gluconate 2-dehydrogenase subunit 3 family protein [Antarcticibacterium sp. 1MA-6-2]|uniref:gluconate 2-dehydrogenase subunit 3 family protein n=1 Tax=Antarcticibacterium sp. 1MA-6-2 TaxID=2908210 RepID=UPI001F23CC1F|nr:gluconate 2-dehydrogenase subunit 3 family protein [Antarcticibacterium sp. 1MA-6-2]UJH90145.1 gluconate 2-dehydrogenase subunit 3 family protein [Antarcticibacterium sp. 1MA-6-2]